MTKIINKKNAIALSWCGFDSNMGSALYEFLITELFGMQVEQAEIDTSEMLGIGSTLDEIHRAVGKNPIIIWGSGFSKNLYDIDISIMRKPEIFALRGKYTKEILKKKLNKEITCAFGDPAILVSLLPEYANENGIENIYDIGIVFHREDTDYEIIEKLKNKYENDNLKVKIINACKENRKVINEIRQCKCILSSSLYGLIVSDAFGIPNLWCQITDIVTGDDFKFHDYYSAYGITVQPIDFRTTNAVEVNDILYNYHISMKMVRERQMDLIMSFPYEGPGKTALLDRFGLKPAEKKKKRYAVVSFITNGYENVKEIEEKDDEAEYIMVSDGSVSADTWDNVFDMSLKEYSAPFDGCLHVRYNLFDYCSSDICISVDGSIEVKHSLKPLVDIFENGNYDAAFMPHPMNDTFADEYNLWIKWRGYSRTQSERCLNYYSEHGYPLDYKGLFQIGFFIVRNNEETRNIQKETWKVLKDIGENGHMERIDQIVFSYVVNSMHSDMNVLPLSEQVLRSYYMQLYGHGDGGYLNLNAFYDFEIPDIKYMFNKEVTCLYLDTPQSKQRFREKEWEQRLKNLQIKEENYERLYREYKAICDERIQVCNDRLDMIHTHEKIIDDQHQKIVERDGVIAEKDRVIAEKDKMIVEKGQYIHELEKAIAELSKKPFNRMYGYFSRKMPKNSNKK